MKQINLNLKKKLLVVANLFSFLILASTLNFNFCCYGMVSKEFSFSHIEDNLNDNLNSDEFSVQSIEQKRIDEIGQSISKATQEADIAIEDLDKRFYKICAIKSNVTTARLNLHKQRKKLVELNNKLKQFRDNPDLSCDEINQLTDTDNTLEAIRSSIDRINQANEDINKLKSNSEQFYNNLIQQKEELNSFRKEEKLFNYDELENNCCSCLLI